MAVTACVLIKADLGKAREVTSAVRGIAGVKEAYAVTGPYDVIALVEAADVKSLGDLVLSKIQATSGVKDTLTCISVE
ncbi:MAG: Lrp/AsnC ligand binding domain-containing protein [Armatimonadota bacterium]|nr:Lrp/AsnC ligand binding domain-containing protein [Armatimonadota bacterium]MDR5702131.1 Lrp/AsnC ligand binding domain-containing protein [Armatimonadota bacterium]MDR7435098.1 Lrp/AsnC ligand binding domain-containing protein [Armatimonadota bacterium]